MIQEPFVTGESIVHRVDPRFRIVLAVCFSIVVAVADKPSVLLAANTVSILLLILAKPDPAAVGKRMGAILGFVILIWLVVPVTHDGPPLTVIGPLTITRPGVTLSLGITLKSIAISLAFISLIATMAVGTLGHALSRLHVSGKMIYLLLMTYRYFFVIEQEYRRLLRAVRMRGFRAGTNLHTYKTVAYLVGMLFVRASERAARVHQAMKCRGFTGSFHDLREYSIHLADVAFAGTLGILIIGLLFMEWIP
jgi:cobalt/nickel transport system permease protein